MYFKPIARAGQQDGKDDVKCGVALLLLYLLCDSFTGVCIVYVTMMMKYTSYQPCCYSL
jgi:hypothetical protein